MAANLNCIVSNCNKEIYAFGMCNVHYRRNIKNGDPIKLSKYEDKRLNALKARKEAKANNLKTYLTQEPCSNGHISERYTKNTRCVKCYEEFLKNKPLRRKYFVKSVYNLSEEEHKTLIQKQNYVCAICEQPEIALAKNGKIRELSIDHCHKTGKIRGLLCSTYNVAIGQLNHNPELLRKAALYCE